MKAIRLVKDPHLKCDVSILALNATVNNFETPINHFFNVGGNALHIHEEGGGTKLTEDLGRWLYDNSKISEAILCCMIGHESEEGYERKDPGSLLEDILRLKTILNAPLIHQVYLDPPSDKAAVSKIIETLAESIRNNNIRSYAFRNWPADQILPAINYAHTSGLPGPVAIVTTEHSSAIPKTPLWEGYTPFDRSLREIVTEFDLTVWAWITDINQPLFVPPDERSGFLTKERMERWLTPENEHILSKFSDIAFNKGFTLRQANAMALLNQPYRVIGIISRDAANLGDLNEFYDIAAI